MYNAFAYKNELPSYLNSQNYGYYEYYFEYSEADYFYKSELGTTKNKISLI